MRRTFCTISLCFGLLWLARVQAQGEDQGSDLSPSSEAVVEDKKSYLTMLYTGFPANQLPLEDPPLKDYSTQREEYTAMLQYFLSSSPSRSHHMRVDMKHHLVFLWEDMSKRGQRAKPCLQVFNFQFLRLLTLGKDEIHENEEDQLSAEAAGYAQRRELLDHFEQIEDVLITEAYDAEKTVRFVVVGRSRPTSQTELEQAPKALLPAKSKNDRILLADYPLAEESVVPLVYIQKLEHARETLFPMLIFEPTTGTMRCVHANAIQTPVQVWKLPAEDIDSYHPIHYYPPIQDPILPFVFSFYTKQNPTELLVVNLNPSDGKMRTIRVISIHPKDGSPIKVLPSPPTAESENALFPLRPLKIMPYHDPTLLNNLFQRSPIDLVRDERKMALLDEAKNGSDPEHIEPRCLLFIYATCVRAVVIDIARIVHEDISYGIFSEWRVDRTFRSAPVWSRNLSDLATASDAGFEFTFHSPYADAALRIADSSTHLGLVSVNRQGAINLKASETVVDKHGRVLQNTPPQSTIQFHCLYLRNLLEQAWTLEDPFAAAPSTQPSTVPPKGLQVVTCPVPLEDWQDELNALLATHSQYVQPEPSELVSHKVKQQHQQPLIEHEHEHEHEQEKQVSSQQSVSSSPVKGKIIHVFLSEKLTVQQYLMTRIALLALIDYKLKLKEASEQSKKIAEAQATATTANRPICLSDRVPVTLKPYVRRLESNSNAFGLILATLIIVRHGLERFQSLRTFKDKLMARFFPDPTLLDYTV